MAEIKLIVVDPYHPVWGHLVPVIVQRLLVMSAQYHEEMDPMAVVGSIMTRLYRQDPTQVLIALVAEDGTVLGHAVASIETDGVNTWVFVPQYRADGNVGDAVVRSLRLAENWAQEYSEKYLVPAGRRPITDLVMATHRGEDAWTRKFQFETLRHVMRRKIVEEPK